MENSFTLTLADRPTPGPASKALVRILRDYGQKTHYERVWYKRWTRERIQNQGQRKSVGTSRYRNRMSRCRRSSARCREADFPRPEAASGLNKEKDRGGSTAGTTRQTPVRSLAFRKWTERGPAPRATPTEKSRTLQIKKASGNRGFFFTF